MGLCVCVCARARVQEHVGGESQSRTAQKIPLKVKLALIFGIPILSSRIQELHKSQLCLDCNNIFKHHRLLQC